MASSGTGGVVENALDPMSPQHVALARLLRERRRNREDGGRSRGVVVGTKMHLARFVLAGERVASLSVSQMIVVRAERDPRLGGRLHWCRGRQIGDDVVAGALLAFHLRVDLDGDAGQREAGRVGVGVVKRFLGAGERFVGHHREDLVRAVASNADRDDA
jgi:hypothetical protein